MKTLNEAAGLANISPGLVTHAAKVVRDGCEASIQVVAGGARRGARVQGCLRPSISRCALLLN